MTEIYIEKLKNFFLLNVLWKGGAGKAQTKGGVWVEKFSGWPYNSYKDVVPDKAGEICTEWRKI
ncbi:MAG: hypothetical protein HFG41_07795 [Coprococcus sp.]|nr:hypothetical protein [Coprococcus sp.]